MGLKDSPFLVGGKGENLDGAVLCFCWEDELAPHGSCDDSYFEVVFFKIYLRKRGGGEAEGEKVFSGLLAEHRA